MNIRGVGFGRQEYFCNSIKMKTASVSNAVATPVLLRRLHRSCQEHV